LAGDAFRRVQTLYDTLYPASVAATTLAGTDGLRGQERDQDDYHRGAQGPGTIVVTPSGRCRASQETSPAHGSSSAADRLSVPLIGGNAIKQPGADGDPMINAEPSWS